MDEAPEVEVRRYSLPRSSWAADGENTKGAVAFLVSGGLTGVQTGDQNCAEGPVGGTT